MDFWFRLPLKTRLGIIATTLMIVAGFSVYWATYDPVRYRPLYSVIKFAPLLFLLWLAWSDLQSIPIWVYLIAPPILIFCALRPGALFVVIPVALIALFVMPKKRRKNNQRNQQNKKSN